MFAKPKMEYRMRRKAWRGKPYTPQLKIHYNSRKRRCKTVKMENIRKELKRKGESFSSYVPDIVINVHNGLVEPNKGKSGDL